MRNLVVSMNITVDGYMSGPNHELDWHFKCWSGDMQDELCAHLAKADTIVLGRITYDAMAKYWPLKVACPSCREEGFAFANMMNSYNKIVFSNNHFLPRWNNSKLANGNVPDEINKIKSRPGKDIIVYGSGKLTEALIKSGMVDEYQLWLHPVVLGEGKRLFTLNDNETGSSLRFTLLGTKRFTSGVVLLHYKTIKSTENESNPSKSKRRIFKRQF